MAVNLVSSFGRARARELLASSFAQFQADRSVVGLARAAARHEQEAERAAAEMHSDRGDVGEYAQLRRQIADREKELSRDSQAKRRMEAAEALAALRPGRRHPGARRDGGRGSPSSSTPASPTSPTRGRWCSPRTSGPAGWARSTSRRPVSALARVRVPKNFNHRSPHARRDLAATLRNARVENDLGARRIKHRSAAADDPVLDDLRQRAARPPRARSCPTGRSACGSPSGGCASVREADALQRKMAERTGSLTRQFDATCDVLEELGYLVPEVGAAGAGRHRGDRRGGRRPGGHRRRTAAGRASGRRPTCWSPSACGPGAWRGLNAGRAGGGGVHGGVRGAAGQPGAARRARPGRWPRRSARCAGSGPGCRTSRPTTACRVTRDLDLGFAWAAYRWADGQSLDRVLAGAEQAGTELSGGDFVRWARQLIDLLDQLAKVAEEPVAGVARAAVGRVRRGVVAVAVGG